MVLGGLNLPYGPGDWYWFSSRIFPPGYNEFYEFPAFSFIWSDLHAHVIALMLTVLAISWALSVLLAKARWNNPTNVVTRLFHGWVDHRVVKTDQYLGFLHLPAPWGGCPGVRGLALQQSGKDAFARCRAGASVS